MKELLEKSKQQLVIPLGDARRKLLIILNVLYIVLVSGFLISERITTGNFVNDPFLYLIYGTAVGLNFCSAIYNIKIFRNRNNNSKDSFIYRNQNTIDLILGYASILPILVQNFCNLIGLGNPCNDAILTDFAMAQSLMIGVVIILGRKAVVVWFIVVLIVLFWNVSSRGWDYEYHYSTPKEVSKYKKALADNEGWAIERQTELKEAGLNPPKITRYFTTWIVFLIIGFMGAYFFSGVTLDIFKIVPTVVSNIEQAMEGSKRMELERKANEEKTNTFINLAHETKTPLTLINNCLKDYIDKYGETEELRIIKRSTDKLTKDIVNFFDLERINRDFNVYDHSQISNFTKVLFDKIILFKQYAIKKKIKIIESIQNDVFIKADPESLDRLANNLIENAIKYTQESGEIIITLNASNDKIEFSVKDNGIGIPEEQQKYVFNPYYQINSEKKNSQGMGLGLSIVKKITDSLNAKIILISNPTLQAGTEIIIQLLKHEILENEPVSEFKSEGNVYVDIDGLNIKEEIFDTGKYTIFLVEDNVPTLNYLANKLSEKYNVFYATSGSEAFEKIKTFQNLDLIVSDVMMDNGDGFDFFKNVTTQKRFAHIPFIFLTAKTDVNDKMKALSLGAIDYIHKPFMIDELSNKIDAIIKTLNENRKALIELAYNNLRHIREEEPDNVDSKNKFEEKCSKFNLTPSEVNIVRLLAKGNTTKLIADSINRSEHTVNKHIQNIFEKVNVKGRVELLNKLSINTDM